MKTRFLFPNRFKKIGWKLLIAGFVGGLINLLLNITNKTGLEVTVFAICGDSGFFTPTVWFTTLKNHITDEVQAIFIIIGAILVAFSKEKHEDEFINQIRLDSLVWATYVNYGLLLLAIVFVYGLPFFNVMLFNLFTTLNIFTIRFKYMLHQHNKASIDEK